MRSQNFSLKKWWNLFQLRNHSFLSTMWLFLPSYIGWKYNYVSAYSMCDGGKLVLIAKDFIQQRGKLTTPAGGSFRSEEMSADPLSPRRIGNGGEPIKAKTLKDQQSLEEMSREKVLSLSLSPSFPLSLRKIWSSDWVNFSIKRSIGGFQEDDQTIYPSNYSTKYVTRHKQECSVAKFSPCGEFVATGSVDTSIKLLDVGKMKNLKQNSEQIDKAKWVSIRHLK